MRRPPRQRVGPEPHSEVALPRRCYRSWVRRGPAHPDPWRLVEVGESSTQQNDNSRIAAVAPSREKPATGGIGNKRGCPYPTTATSTRKKQIHVDSFFEQKSDQGSTFAPRRCLDRHRYRRSQLSVGPLAAAPTPSQAAACPARGQSRQSARRLLGAAGATVAAAGRPREVPIRRPPRERLGDLRSAKTAGRAKRCLFPPVLPLMALLPGLRDRTPSGWCPYPVLTARGPSANLSSGP